MFRVQGLHSFAHARGAVSGHFQSLRCAPERTGKTNERPRTKVFSSVIEHASWFDGESGERGRMKTNIGKGDQATAASAPKASEERTSETSLGEKLRHGANEIVEGVTHVTHDVADKVVHGTQDVADKVVHGAEALVKRATDSARSAVDEETEDKDKVRAKGQDAKDSGKCAPSKCVVQ